MPAVLSIRAPKSIGLIPSTAAHPENSSGWSVLGESHPFHDLSAMEKAANQFCHFCASGLEDRRVEGRVRRYCPSCRIPIYENPVPAACALVIDHYGRVLLVKRRVAPKAGMWCLPGGFVECGESPEQTAVRELREETGLDGWIHALIGATTTPGTRYRSVLLVAYLVTTFSGAPEPGDDACDLAFFDRHHLPDIAFDTHETFIRMYYTAFAASAPSACPPF